VPPDHLACRIDAVLDLSWVHKELAPYYSHTGRPSMDPVLMIRMLIVGFVTVALAVGPDVLILKLPQPGCRTKFTAQGPPPSPAANATEFCNTFPSKADFAASLRHIGFVP
jgi:hypothetical protein